MRVRRDRWSGPSGSTGAVGGQDSVSTTERVR